MGFEVEVLEDVKKGSNPGRKVSFPDIGGLGDCYLKYCPGSRVSREIDLSAHNQPFYEAITNHLCRELGLPVPKTLVLRDGGKGEKDRKVKFKGSSFNGGREYFVSELVEKPEGNVAENSGLVKEILNKDRPYLELLGVEDVFTKGIGRRDNYHFFKYPGGEDTGGEITYIDLGCSLGIRAKEGNMGVRDKDLKSSRDLRRMKKRIDPWSIISRDGERIIPLVEIIENFEDIPIITMNPCDNSSISNYLSRGETDQIKDMLTFCIYECVQKYRHDREDIFIRD